MTSQFHPDPTILVVEDEGLMRRLLERLLSALGSNVLLAADGEEAIEIYRHHKRDITFVLLDLGLPKISGWEVFNNLKEENPEVRVIVASGYMEPDIKRKMHDAGVEHFVEKPYLLDNLVQTVERLIEESQDK